MIDPGRFFCKIVDGEETYPTNICGCGSCSAAFDAVMKNLKVEVPANCVIWSAMTAAIALSFISRVISGGEDGEKSPTLEEYRIRYQNTLLSFLDFADQILVDRSSESKAVADKIAARKNPL